MIYSIVVTYNGDKWVHKCFGSLVNSAVTNHRILAIDNGSIDNTVELIRNNYPSVEIIETGDNLGFGKANNIGIKKAINDNADFVFLLNQDAWVDKDTVLELIEISKKNLDYGILSPMHWNGENELIDFNVNKFLYETGLLRRIFSDLLKKQCKDLYYADFINAAIWLLPKHAVKKVGLFDSIFFHYGEDRNYCQRIKFHGLKVGIVPSCKGYHDRESVMLNKMTPHKYNLISVATFLRNTCNINKNNFLHIFLINLLLIVKGLIRNMIKLKIAYVIEDFKILIKTIFLVKKIRVSRSNNKKLYLSKS